VGAQRQQVSRRAKQLRQDMRAETLDQVRARPARIDRADGRGVGAVLGEASMRLPRVQRGVSTSARAPAPVAVQHIDRASCTWPSGST
jgi:hypothetical protein